MNMTVVSRIEEEKSIILRGNKVLIYFWLTTASHEKIIAKKICKNARESIMMLRKGDYVQITGIKAYDYIIKKVSIVCTDIKKVSR